jgi:ribose transport system ATP-binding protein
MQNKNSELILSIKGVSKSFPGVKALDNVSVDVKTGVVHGVVGENGAGKSTLMKILSGVYTKDEGTITFDGKKHENLKPIDALHRGLSIIYQEFNLVNSMSVGENILLGRFKEMGGMRKTHAKAKELLKSIYCDINTNVMVNDLSVSEKQMVEITKALAYDSKLIIMDEPSSALTVDELKHLIKIIHQLKENGISVIYISHKLDEIFDFCDMATVMRDGNIISTKPTSEYTRPEMISKMIGRDIENEFPERPRNVGETLLEVRSLNTRKLHNISFDLKKGEILGLVGLVGAGRTEIVRALFGADKVKGHTIKIDGKVVKIKSPADAIKAGIGFISEDRKEEGLILPQTAEANITIAKLKDLRKAGFLDSAEGKRIANKHVESLAIKTPSIKTVVKSLSGGNQQKCIVGRWIEMEPRIFIMDEPTRGIDVGTKYEIYLLMKRIAENGGSVVMISSELPEVLHMSNRVLTMSEGHITGEFNPETVAPDTIMERTLGVEEDAAI